MAGFFSYLNDYDYIFICQDNENKSLFDIILGWPGADKRKKLKLTKAEREKLELFLLSDNDVTVEELSTGVQFCPSKEYCKPPIIEKKTFKNKAETKCLFYGEVMVTKGAHKGKIGYYDDDEDNKAIVYFGHPYITDKYR